nr:hypothetical protein [Roseovarius sp. A-2]
MVNTPSAVLVGIVYGYLPLMVFPIYVALEKLDKSLLEAASDLGTPPWRRDSRAILDSFARALVKAGYCGPRPLNRHRPCQPCASHAVPVHPVPGQERITP